MIEKIFTRCILDPLKALPIFLLYGVARLLPIDLSSSLFGNLAKLLGPLLKVTQRGRENLRLAFPEKTEEDIEQLLKKVWYSLGQIAGEFPHVRRIAQNGRRTQTINLPILEKAMKSNRPVLLMAGHLGNWEIPHYVIVKNKFPVALISRPPNSFFVKKLFDWTREHPLVTIFFKGTEGSRKMMQHLKNKGSLGILFDQRLSDGTPLTFFGHPALTALGPAKLAKKYNALVLPVQVERLHNKSRFRVTFHEPIDTKGSPEEIMTQCNDHLETWIRKNPEQWLWLHKRWRL